MAAKTTPAGYRIPVSSEYHQRCISNRVKEIDLALAREKAASSDKTNHPNYNKNCNVVSQERLWKDHVHKEIQRTKKWYANYFTGPQVEVPYFIHLIREEHWGFMLDYDYQVIITTF